MAREFLGRGWAFPLKTTHDGRIALSEYEAGIRESIILILGTSKGERVMRPDFGCGIHDYTFSTIDTASLALIERSVREALTLWEPRLELKEVEISTKQAGEGKLIITINYEVRKTNNRYNLVYPFYLTEAEQ
jgi:phage baseplate assembly protein W